MPQKAESVDEYIAGFSEETQLKLQQIRQLIKAEAPEASEVISYAIPAYKLPGVGHAFVFFSGFAKHIGMYPVPQFSDQTVAQAVAPYIAGKGTLRFPLDQPLPVELIKQVVEQLHRNALGE